MKYELLKRTAIALFVGSVLSTYAMAEDDTLVDATNNLKNAIKQEVKIQTEASKAEQDKNIQGVKTAVSKLAKGIDDALLPAIATNRTDIDKNTSNIKNLATGIRDGLVPAIEANRTDIDKNTSNIKNLATGIRDGLVPAIEANRTDIDANKAEIEKIKNLQGYDSLTKVENIVSNKADQDYVEGLEQDVKALQSDMGKAATAVNTLSDNVQELNNAQNTINENFNDQLLAVNETLDEHKAGIDANKADVDTLKNRADGAATAVNLLAQNIALNKTNIESKADQDYVEGLEQDVKINTSDIKELSKGIRDSILPALEANRTDIDKNASRITDTRNKQVLQNARLDNHGERIDANKAAIGELAKATDEAVTNLGNAVSGLDEDLAGTQDAVAENRKDIDKNASRITDTRNKQVLQNARLDNHNSRIDANKADVDTLKNRADGAAAAVNLLAQNIALNKTNIESKADQDYVEGLEQDVKINTSDIKELSKGIRDSILPALEANRTDIDKNASRITDTRNKQVLQNARLDNHNSRIDANKADVDTLKNRADGAAAAVNLLAQNIALNKTNIESKADQDYVEGLEQDVKINTSDIKELSKGIRDSILPALEANRTDIDKNASRITDTRNKQVLQNARLDNHSSRIDANKAALESKADKTALAAKADKTALEAKADKTALEAKADKTALEAKADKVYVGSLEQNIRDNSNRIETNKVAVSALRNDINSHAKRLDHLDNRVNKLDKDLKRGLATQAALTGLFQPYTVGKANFTAAVGGYKSQTAVAIGTGYRYNKHVATKAGVAFTQGGAAYNVGVNFEW